MLKTTNLQFQHSTHFEIDAINLTIEKGEIISLIGPNGSGKSTFLRLIARLLKPDAGTVLLEGQSIHSIERKKLAQQLAMLPQMNNHQLDLTVGELIEFGRSPHVNKYGRMKEEDYDIVEWALEVTNLTKYRDRVLPSLSGGERQRAWIAMAIAQRPKVLLLDEPTTYLDISHQLEVMELVKALNEQLGMTIVMVLHDINQAARYSDRLIVMKKGKVQYDGTPQCVLCREMFQNIFEIDASIYEEAGTTFFTPTKMTTRCAFT
ncbi:MAG TPA: ABC transporter ATP-binding protein [Savagea sp.]